MRLRLIGVGVLVAGITLVTFLIFKVIDAFPAPVDSGLVGTPITATLDSDGVTILVDDPSYQIDCGITDSTGRPIPLYQPGGTTTITVNGHSWWVALESTNPTPPGTYTATCTSADAGLAYAVGERGNVLSMVGMIFGIIGTIIATIVIVIALFVIAGVRKRKAQRQQLDHFSYPAPPPPMGQNPYESRPPGPGQTYTEY
ncbi:MAG: hypothetical protein LLG14_03045 [Nocardiaceae bacterium]|nr:hypothetical protein [Nocardiaceae bacterium]